MYDIKIWNWNYSYWIFEVGCLRGVCMVMVVYSDYYFEGFLLFVFVILVRL